MMNKKYFTILIHLSGWIAFFIFPFVLLNFPAESHSITFPEIKHSNNGHPLLPFFIINNFLFILLFYFNLFYLLPALYFRQKKARYFIIMTMLLLVAVYLPPLIKNLIIPRHYDFSKEMNGRPFREIDRIFGFLHFLIIWFLSSIICLAQRYRRMEQRNKEMKVQKLASELSYLKAQVNPHFLFNMLNNIYSLSVCQSEQTPEAILKLSAIMRYVTQDAEADMVPLEKELDYLGNYIDLQRLRSNNNLQINFIIHGDVHYKMIAPLLLINFVENAFKHGVSNHIECFVHIQINLIDNHLTMEVINKKIENSLIGSTATGSNNTKRRLQLQYPRKHLFTIDETGGLYKITLELNLS